MKANFGSDAALVETILLDKLTAAAEEARAKMGFAWADAMLRYDYAAMADFGRVYPGPIEPDEKTQKRIDEITADLEQLQLEMEDDAGGHRRSSALDRLHRKGLIHDPVNWSKSVVLTDEGLQCSKVLFQRSFARPPQ